MTAVARSWPSAEPQPAGTPSGRVAPFVPVRDALVSCGTPHRDGSLDESARRLSHEELRVAERLASEGHAVRSLPEGRQRGRTADLEVCGVPVEVKSWLSLADRQGGAPGWRSVVNTLIAAEGQSRFVVLSAAGSGLTASDAATGIARYAAGRPKSPISTVRAIGDGFDLSWGRVPVVERTALPSCRRGLGAGM